ETGQIVLSDRYADATVAYQGAGRGFSEKLISEIVDLATDGLKPDLTLLFDLPVAACVARTKRRRGTGQLKRDRLDTEAAEFHSRVRDAYLKLAKDEPERVRVIDTSGSVEETHAKVKEIITAFFEQRGVNLNQSTKAASAKSKKSS